MRRVGRGREPLTRSEGTGGGESEASKRYALSFAVVSDSIYVVVGSSGLAVCALGVCKQHREYINFP